MAVIGVALVRLRDLFGVVMLSGLFTLTAASLYVVMDAVDVAFTEAAVGAGIATVLMLETLALTTGREKVTRRRSLAPFLMVVVTGAVLIYGTLDMPRYGDPGAPIHQHATSRSPGARSASPISLPRYWPAIAATTPWARSPSSSPPRPASLPSSGAAAEPAAAKDRRPRVETKMRGNIILRVASKLLIPCILLFALYVQFHGDFGPGGGFQAGVIFGSAFILYALIVNIESARRAVPAVVSRVALALGLLLYAGVGVAGMFLGGRYLNYSVLAEVPTTGQHLGITLIELGVGITVAAAMITVFYVFAGEER